MVALGGGHGLHASLSALRLLPVDISAVVTVADDGGSSGRIRRELGVLPPGDLRMALAALSRGDAGVSEPPLPWSELLQHRVGGAGALAGHPIGNLLLTGLLELRGDPVAALGDLAALIGASGRVLPMSPLPLDLVAVVASVDRDDPIRSRRIRGQSAIAATSGRVQSVELVPPDAPACDEAVAAVRDADTVVLGPGSWFTSVIPHLLVPDLAVALAETAARVVVILNLEPQVGETDDFSPEDYLQVLLDHRPGFRVDAVLADSERIDDAQGLVSWCRNTGARLVLAPLAASDGAARHDPTRLSRAIATVCEFGGPTAEET